MLHVASFAFAETATCLIAVRSIAAAWEEPAKVANATATNSGRREVAVSIVVRFGCG